MKICWKVWADPNFFYSPIYWRIPCKLRFDCSHWQIYSPAFNLQCFIHSCELRLKAGLHRNANTNAACENDAYVHVGKFLDCSAFAEAANRPYINVLYANSLWCTDSWRKAFGCSPNVHHTAKCCLPRLRNMSTLNVHIVFAYRVRILFAFRCKRSLRHKIPIASIPVILMPYPYYQQISAFVCIPGNTIVYFGNIK